MTEWLKDMWHTMTFVERRKRTITFPQRARDFYVSLLLVWCCLSGVRLGSASSDSGIQYNRQQVLETYLVKEQTLPSTTHYRITSNHAVPVAHRRTRDAWRSPVQEDFRRVTVNNHGPYLRRKYSSTHPWISLYHQDHHYATSSNVYGTTSSPVLIREPSRRYHSMTLPPPQRISSSGQMVTVLKTQGPSPVQDVQSKDFFNDMYGTKEGVSYLKGNYGPANLSQAKVTHGVDQELEDVRLANEHFLRMRKNWRCHVPVPEVVCVKELYPSATKDYLPRCTLLHRCGDKSGCCDSEVFKCVPKAIQEVSLNFYTLLVGSRTSETNIAYSVEKLLFENHTECECAQIDDLPIQTEDHLTTKTTTTTIVPVLDQKPQKDHHSQHTTSVQLEKCRECPEPFCRREYADGRCGCDCFDKQKPCLRIKRGREPLQETERRCVETGKCHIPDCEFGTYNYSSGRCPKRPEDFPKPMKNGHKKDFENPNHRWNFVERD